MAGEYLTTTRYAISIITSEQDVASDRLDVILESAQDYATAVGQCLATHLEADARAAAIPIPLHTAYVVEEAVNLPLNFDDIEEQTSAPRVTDVVLEVCNTSQSEDNAMARRGFLATTPDNRSSTSSPNRRPAPMPRQTAA